MRQAHRLSLVALLGALSVNSAVAQVSWNAQSFIITVSPGISVYSQQWLDWDPTLAGNGDGFFTVGDGQIWNTQPAIWALDGTEGLTVAYEITSDGPIYNMADPSITLPYAGSPEAEAECSTGKLIWNPDFDPAAAPISSGPCDLTGMLLPLSPAVTLDRVIINLVGAVPGDYEGQVRLTATVQ